MTYSARPATAAIRLLPALGRDTICRQRSRFVLRATGYWPRATAVTGGCQNLGAGRKSKDVLFCVQGTDRYWLDTDLLMDVPGTSRTRPTGTTRAA